MRHRMDVTWVRGLPVLVIRVDMAESVVNLGHILLLNHSVWGDTAAYRHQLTHIEQLIDHWYVGHLLMWWLSKRYRLRMDADAYRVELACSPSVEHQATKLRLIGTMAEQYGIDEGRARVILSMTKGCPI